MLDARVFSFGVLSDRDDVDIVIRSLVSLDRFAWSNVGKEIELPEIQRASKIAFQNPYRHVELSDKDSLSKGKIERLMALADWRSQRTLQADLGALYRINRLLRNPELAVSSSDWRDVNGFLK